MEINNIEKFYEDNHQSLIEDNGRRPLRPTKSYTKDIIACFEKFKELYRQEGLVEHTKKELGKVLSVDVNTTLQNIRSMQEFGFLTGTIDESDGEEAEEQLSESSSSESVYKLTPSFVELINSDITFGSFLYEKLSHIRSIEDFTPYLNLLLCTLREAAIYNEAISFGPIGYEKYKTIVPNSEDRQKLRDRIYKIYGYYGRRSRTQSVNSDNYLPNISYMSLGTLEDLGLLKKDREKNEYNLNTYSLTYPAIHLLKELNDKLHNGKNTMTNFFASSQQIYYGAPGTGKSFEIDTITKEYDTIRTTFHPDSDYSTFVGAYKPTMTKVELRDVSGHVVMDGKNPVQEDRITYKFVKQAFRKAYLAAWKKYAEDNEGEEVRPQFLVIDIVFPVLWSQFFAVRVAFF